MRRRLVRDGALGAVRLVQVEYIQSGLATRLEDGPSSNRLAWILDPQRSGLALVMSAIGCHAQHLACFASGLAIARVAADVGALMPGRKVVDYTSALMEFEGGARGTLTVTQAAAGGENDIRLRVYGEKGMLDWSHRDASYLRLALQGEPARVIGRGDPGLPPEIIAAGARRAATRKACAKRSPTSTARSRRSAWRARWARRFPDAPYPRIEEGAHTMAFIEACVESQRRGGWAAVRKVGLIREFLQQDQTATDGGPWRPARKISIVAASEMPSCVPWSFGSALSSPSPGPLAGLPQAIHKCPAAREHRLSIGALRHRRERYRDRQPPPRARQSPPRAAPTARRHRDAGSEARARPTRTKRVFWRTSIAIGMSDDEVLNLPSWGRPSAITRSKSNRVWHEEWLYRWRIGGTSRLLFANGRLTAVETGEGDGDAATPVSLTLR